MPRGFLSDGSGHGPSSSDEDVTVDVVLKRDLELSWGVMIPGQQRDDQMIWIPKGLSTLTGGEQPACKAKLTVPAWLATKKRLA